MEINIVNKSKHELPSYKTSGSSGMDIRADIGQSVLLAPGARAAIPTGLFLEIPEGTEAQVRPRSGLAIKSGITVLNSPGTIDADYRGEVAVILVNLSQDDFIIQDGDRVAQLVVNRVEKVTWKIVKALTKTIRGKGGFGSTGKK
tara:strand:+ start:713 stop:1147 length:435 start_codon:yes stop_codon:yes gene_type:complete